MSILLSARIDDEINTELKAIANQERLTRTAIVKAALTSYLKDRKSKLAHQMSILHKIENVKSAVREEA